MVVKSFWDLKSEMCSTRLEVLSDLSTLATYQTLLHPWQLCCVCNGTFVCTQKVMKLCLTVSHAVKVSNIDSEAVCVSQARACFPYGIHREFYHPWISIFLEIESLKEKQCNLLNNLPLLRIKTRIYLSAIY